MSARATWKGLLKISLVTIPLGLGASWGRARWQVGHPETA